MKQWKSMVICLLFFIFTGCAETSNTSSSGLENASPKPLSDPLLLDLELVRNESVVTMVGNELLCEKGFADDNEMKMLYSSSFYSYHMDTGQSELLGYRNRFLYGTGMQVACQDDAVFLYDGVEKNYIYEINLKEGRSEVMSEDPDMKGRTFFMPADDSLLICKTYYNENSTDAAGRILLEKYFLQKGRIQKLLEFPFSESDHGQKEGMEILNMAYASGKIYIFSAEHLEGTANCFLAVYNADGSLQKKIEVEDSIGEFLRQSEYVDIDENYFFISDYEGKSILLKIQADEIEQIGIPEEKLALADGGYKNVSPLIVRQTESGKLYYFDKESEELKEIPFESPVEGYAVSNVIRDDQNHLLIVLEAILDPDVSYTDETWPPKKLYFTTLEDLLRQPA